MTSKSYWKRLTLDFARELKTVRGMEEAELGGIRFGSLPGVFSPARSSDTAWFAAKVIPLIKGRSFLEIGSGSGAIACLAALKGATSVVATDISQAAIQNILLNQKRLGLHFSVRHGNVYEPISRRELFDVIFWNHPFNYTEDASLEEDPILATMFDCHYTALKKFITGGRHHLSADGQILLGSSNIARISMIKKIALAEGFNLTLLNKTTVPIYKSVQAQMDIRLYSLSLSKNILKLTG